jgi:hypothetical protein
MTLMIRSKALQTLLVGILIDVVNLPDTTELYEARHRKDVILRGMATRANLHQFPFCLHHVLELRIFTRTAFHPGSPCFPFSHCCFPISFSFGFTAQNHMKGRRRIYGGNYPFLFVVFRMAHSRDSGLGERADG